MKIVTGILILLILFEILTSLLLRDKISISDIIVPIVIMSVLPILTYFRAKSIFNTNKRAGETIEYIFEDDYLTMKGESFNSQLTWDKLYRVTQSKNWIFIWQNKQFANPLPKRDIWEGEIQKLKEILNEHRIKNTL